MPRSLDSISAGVLLVVIVAGLLHARRPNDSTWRIERILCPVAPLCSPFECELKKPNRNTQVMNFMCTLRRPLTQAKIHVRSFVRTGGGFKKSMVDNVVDYCEILAETGSSSNMLARMVRRYMMHDTNVNHTCPVEGVALYRDIRITPGWVMNTWVPKDRYRIDFRFYDQSTNETFILVQVFTSTL